MLNTEHDAYIWKELNVEIKDYKVKLKPQYYDKSPFVTENKSVIPIIIKYAEKLDNLKSRAFLLSVLGVKGFDDAVPYLVQQYKFYSVHVYSEPFDDLILLHLCNTIMKIESNKHIELYVEMLKMPSTTALECIIIMADKLKMTELETHIFNLIEKENKIPEAWIGQPNEVDKYWCSQKALEYMVKRKNKEHIPFIEKFLNPEDLEWIKFSKSRFEKDNYANCYKAYKTIALRGIKDLK